MPILPQIDQIIQSEVWPKVGLKLWPMFSLGINALSLNKFDSLNSNARTVKGTAGMMQMYRLVRRNLVNVFTNVMIKLFKITDDSFINIDFTIFDPFVVLCFALQTNSGRAIPVWIETIKYPIRKDSQNLFILQSLDKFIKLINCHPKIVCDRGFIGDYLINGFTNLGLTFYVRMKAGKTIIRKLKRRTILISLRKVNWLDFTGVIYGRNLRVIRSSKTLQKKLNLPECWYIITNDFKANREQILNTYYHRFEIEENFKDIKHIFEAKKNYIDNIQTLETILWFQILGIWLIWLTSIIPKIRINIKKKISWFRQSWELLLQERTLPIVLVPNYQFNSNLWGLYQV